MLLKEVTLEDLRQAARTGGLPNTPERQAASRGHAGIPAALSGVEPFVRTAGGQSSGTGGQPTAERIMEAQRGRLNEFGQSLGEGPDEPSLLNLPQGMQNAFDYDEAHNPPDSSYYDTHLAPLPDQSLSDPMTAQPPEVTSSIDPDHSSKLLSRLHEQQPLGPDADYEAIHQQNMEMYGPARNRERVRSYGDDSLRDVHGHPSAMYTRRPRTVLGDEYGPLVQNRVQNGNPYADPRREPKRAGAGGNTYDPFSLANRIQTEEPSMDDEVPVSRPPEGRNPAQMEQLGQTLAGFPEFPEGVEQDYDMRGEQESAQANRAKSLASQSAQQSSDSPIDAAMQALGNRKTEEAARVPAPVERTPLNQQGRNKGRGRGRNSQRNQRRR